MQECDLQPTSLQSENTKEYMTAIEENIGENAGSCTCFFRSKPHPAATAAIPGPSGPEACQPTQYAVLAVNPNLVLSKPGSDDDSKAYLSTFEQVTMATSLA